MDTGCLDRIAVASRLAQMRAVIVPELAERVRSTCVAEWCAASADAEQITVGAGCKRRRTAGPTPRRVGDSTPCVGHQADPPTSRSVGADTEHQGDAMSHQHNGPSRRCSAPGPVVTQVRSAGHTEKETPDWRV